MSLLTDQQLTAAEDMELLALATTLDEELETRGWLRTPDTEWWQLDPIRYRAKHAESDA